MMRCSSFTAETLITARPKFPFSILVPPVVWKHSPLAAIT
ncbi:Uncharacterised protein [Vibrio cholerae]|nr:Uncharacterised protein [Vibrio cholerae]